MKVKIVAYLLMALMCYGIFEGGAYMFNKSLTKKLGRTSLDQTAVRPSGWLPHKLNVTYGQGSPPDTVKYYDTHSKQGFKYPREISKDKPKKTVRIFGMGGSTLYGWGADGLERYGNHKPLANDETITYFLEKRLNDAVKKSHPDWNVEVINAAVIDYNSAFHLVYYNKVIWTYNPDMLIFLDGNNEFFGIKPFNTFAEYKNTGVNIIRGFNNRLPHFTRYVVARNLAQYSNFFNTVQYKIMNKWLEKEAPTINKIYELPATFDNFDRDYAARAQLFLRTYSQLKAAADFDKLKMIVFLGPQMLMEDPKGLSEKDLATRKEVLVDWASPNGLVDRGEFMRRVRAKLPGYFASIGVHYDDSTSYLSSPAVKAANKGTFIDYTHVTPDGAKEMADKMFAPAYKDVLEIIAKSPQK